MQLLYRINRTGTTVLVVTHDREMVDKMRRRVIALDEGRVVRDEASAGYHDESTQRVRGARARRDGRRARATRMASRSRGDRRDPRSSSSPRPSGRCAAAPRRAWRRSSRSCVTTLLLGVLVPVLKASSTTNQDVARPARPAGLPLRRRDQDAGRWRCRARSTAIPHVERTKYVSKAEALKTAAQARSARAPERRASTQLKHNPLPASYQRLARRPRQPRLDPPGDHAARRQRQAEADQPGDRGRQRLPGGRATRSAR